MKTAPQKEHQWLKQLLGEWRFEGEAVVSPGQPPIKTTGMEKVHALGDLWVLCEGRGAMPDDGAMANMLMTLGYDTQKKAFVGSWVGSMMTNIWVYRGALDASGTVLTLDTEGPSMSGDGTQARYQDVITLKSADERELSSQVQQDDGTWKRFMTTAYWRVALSA